MERDKIWTKDFLCLLVSNFFVSLSFYLLMTSMAVYAIKEFQVTESRAGLAVSIFIIGALFARIFAGKFIDVIGRKKNDLLRTYFIFNWFHFLFICHKHYFFNDSPLYSRNWIWHYNDDAGNCQYVHIAKK